MIDPRIGLACYNFFMAEKFRVLIVDDHQEIRTALRANLEAFEVDLDLVDVPSGEEAIIEVVGTGIDLLIADVGLPGLSGIELYKKLKHTFPDISIQFHTCKITLALYYTNIRRVSTFDS